MSVRTLSHADRMALEELEARLKTILPGEYQDSYEGMEPVPMRSAGLKYGSDGKVAWNEIRNVVTVTAKTSHYWLEHMPRAQQRGIASLFARLARESPLVEPALTHVGQEPAATALSDAITRDTGRHASKSPYAGWLGVECSSVKSAIWMMRALVAGNVLSRREGTTLFVPVNPDSDPGGGRVARALARAHRLAAARDIH